MIEAPPRRHGRRLSSEELELWRSVTRHVAARRDAVAALAPVPPPVPKAPSSPATATVARPAAPKPPAVPPLAPLERRLRQKLVRGQIAADASLDLHGLRQDEAFRALFAFLAAAQQRGARVVLIVTGKGGRGGAAGEQGVLRRAVPLWLGAAPVRALIVGFEEAGAGHGGAGALYVRLRRRPTAPAPSR